MKAQAVELGDVPHTPNDVEFAAKESEKIGKCEFWTNITAQHAQPVCEDGSVIYS